MSSVLAEIDRDELHARMERGDELVLVDALGPISYGAAHLPGAINIPPDRVDAVAARRIPNPDTLVVVYCAGADCVSSVEVAERLSSWATATSSITRVESGTGRMPASRSSRRSPRALG